MGRLPKAKKRKCHFMIGENYEVSFLKRSKNSRQYSDYPHMGSTAGKSKKRLGPKFRFDYDQWGVHSLIHKWFLCWGFFQR